MTNIARLARRGVAGLLLLIAPSAGWAQAQAEKKAPAVEVEEVTVTAQRREENIQETPVSVTALTSAALEEQRLSNFNDIAASVPAVRVLHTPVGASAIMVTTRGLAEVSSAPAFVLKGGMYRDGGYIAQIAGSNFDLEHLDHVEVLRGLRGTLYGRNTIVGAVNFTTMKPTEDRSVTVKTAVCNYDTFNSRLTLNLPLIGKNGFFQSDALGTLSLRETAGYKGHDGYYSNGNTASMPVFPGSGGGTICS
jgi:iron complex outermembrane receptor protein